MTIDQLRDLVFELSVTAEINQRYHQGMATYWQNWGLAFQALTAATTIVVLTLSIFSYLVPKNKRLGAWSIGASLASAIGGVTLLFVPFGAWQCESTAFLGKWTEVRTDADSLDARLLAHDGDSIELPVDSLSEYEALKARANTLNGQETAPWSDWLDECQEVAQYARTGFRTAEEAMAARKSKRGDKAVAEGSTK